MSNLKQATLNEHVNLEAIEAFADKLARQTEDIVSRAAFCPSLTPAETAALAALGNAEMAMRLAYKLACDAQQKAHEVFRQRVYGNSTTT